jgi:hypothetical protein
MAGLVLIFLPSILAAMFMMFMMLILFMMVASLHLTLFVMVSGVLISKRKDGMLAVWVMSHVIWVSVSVYYDYVFLYYELFQLFGVL